MTRGNLNNLLNFTVFIYNVGFKIIVGTGFIVSKDCKIVTCKHVLTMAKNYAEQKQVGILIPWLGLTSDDCKYATVCAEFDDPSYDVVLLKLHESIALKSQNIARIDSAEGSDSHEFRSYGYRPISNASVPDKYKDTNYFGYAQGKILGLSSSESIKVELKASGLCPGLSGAAVFDDVRKRVIGVISHRYDFALENPDALVTTDDMGKALGTYEKGWAVDAYVLSLPPINLSKHSEIQTKKSLTVIYPNYRVGPITILYGAPNKQDQWVKRKDLLEELDIYWLEQKYSVIELVGSGGQGKSILARQWLDSLLSNSQEPKPSVFWWSFYSENTEKNVNLFFQKLLEFVCGDKKSKKLFSQTEVLSKLKSVLKKGQQWLLILDGLEEVQNLDGSLQRNEIKELLSYFANGRHNVFCLITSRLYVRDLILLFPLSYCFSITVNIPTATSLILALYIVIKRHLLQI